MSEPRMLALVDIRVDAGTMTPVEEDGEYGDPVPVGRLDLHTVDVDGNDDSVYFLLELEEAQAVHEMTSELVDMVSFVTNEEKNNG